MLFQVGNRSIRQQRSAARRHFTDQLAQKILPIGPTADLRVGIDVADGTPIDKAAAPFSGKSLRQSKAGIRVVLACCHDARELPPPEGRGV